MIREPLQERAERVNPDREQAALNRPREQREQADDEVRERRNSGRGRRDGH